MRTVSGARWAVAVSRSDSHGVGPPLLRYMLILQTPEPGEMAGLATQLARHEFDADQLIYTAADDSGHALLA